MGSHAGGPRHARMTLRAATAGMVTMAVLLVMGALAWAQSPTVPQWQTDAGGKMAFDVASVKLNRSGVPPSGDRPGSNVSLDGDAYSPNGGLFSGRNLPLYTYMIFAYKISGSQYQLLRPQLPGWATTERFDIQARASGNPTKDQMRLMMQSLLADRFKLAIHLQTRQLPEFGLILVKPGKTGPHLQPHSDDPPCSAPPSPDPTSTPQAKALDLFPRACGAIVIAFTGPSTAARVRMGARNVTFALVESALAGYGSADGSLDRPLLDQTGLTGPFDFSFVWTPQPNGSAPANFQPDPDGPTFLEALKEQLGLKLVPQTGPVDVLVIDHVEESSPN
jgi:bla regulator protein blaR1